MEGKWKLLPFRLVPWEKEKNTQDSRDRVSRVSCRDSEEQERSQECLKVLRFAKVYGQISVLFLALFVHYNSIFSIIISFELACICMFSNFVLF